MKRFFSLTVLALFLMATMPNAFSQESDSLAVQETEVATEAAQEQPQPAGSLELWPSRDLRVCFWISSFKESHLQSQSSFSTRTGKE